MRVNPSKFRDPVKNTRYTKQLFNETWIDTEISKRSITPLFSLHQDTEGCINFRKRYVELGDKTGYKIANELLENYDHWLILMKLKWFHEAKALWDIELDAKIEADAASVFKGIAKDDSLKPSERISAAKALLSLRPRTQEAKRRAGRPTNEEVEGELKRSAEEARTIEEDKQRIRLVSDTGTRGS